ncbi:hypothetical protein OAJ56_02315, partial [Flavobacteriales bacterium]|nr:hypothetical protein [Flavobacteriales bacterium]
MKKLLLLKTMKKLLLILLCVPLIGFGQETGCISGDCENGYGTYIIDTGYYEGLEYVGEFKDGKFHGEGTYGDEVGTYVGQWKDNVFNGNGEVTVGTIEFPIVVYVGKFKDGSPIGNFKCAANIPFSFTYVGEILEAFFPFYVHHGHGTWIGGEGRYKGDKYVGEWKEGKKDGEGTYTYSNGDKYVGEWKGDEKHGEGTYTYDDGTIKKGLWENNEFIG